MSCHSSMERTVHMTHACCMRTACMRCIKCRGRVPTQSDAACMHPCSRLNHIGRHAGAMQAPCKHTPSSGQIDAKMHQPAAAWRDVQIHCGEEQAVRLSAWLPSDRQRGQGTALPPRPAPAAPQLRICTAIQNTTVPERQSYASSGSLPAPSAHEHKMACRCVLCG